MRATLDLLLVTLGDLEDFVKSIEPVNLALASHADSLVRRYLTVRRRLDYAAFVVALYAAFERFVEDLVWSSAELAASRYPYAELAEALRKKHLTQSGELLAKARLGDGRYSDVTETDVVDNLHGCLSGKARYRLNRHAVVYHEKNLRADVVQGLFGSIGVDDIHRAARRAAPLLQWYRDVQGVEPPEEGVPLTSIVERLKDLVDRRNQVAHVGGPLDESLGSADMQALLEFVRAYGRSLYDVTVGTYLRRAYVEGPGASVDLGQILEGPFRNGAVVVGKPNSRVFQGQPVLGCRGGVVDRWGYVREIRVDGRAVRNVTAASGASTLGLVFDFKVTKNTKLYLVKKGEDAVWRCGHSPPHGSTNCPYATT